MADEEGWPLCRGRRWWIDEVRSVANYLGDTAGRCREARPGGERGLFRLFRLFKWHSVLYRQAADL